MTANGSQQIQAVSVIPPFNTINPSIWFAQIEAQFNNAKIIEEKDKFSHLLGNVDTSIAEIIYDLASSTHENTYTLAKERINNAFKESDENKIKKLTSKLELGDSKPSQLLRKMQQLAGKDISGKALKTFWMAKLPPNMQNILIISDEPIDKIAIMADKIAENTSKPENHNFCHSINKTLEDRIKSLEERINKLENQDKIIIQNKPHPRSYSRSREREKNNSKNINKTTYNGLCYFHFKYGDKCRKEKCYEPCNYSQKNE